VLHQRADEPKPHTRLDPATRRALLVEAAADVFKGRELNEVRFEEVAEAAGVSRSLVYAYFGDRGGLVAAVYLKGLEQLDNELGRTLDERLPDEVRLRRLIRRYLQFARDNEAAWQLMVATGSQQHPAVQAARRARIERIASTWGEDASARLVARAVVGLLEAGAQDWLDYRDTGIERATRVLLAVLWEGLPSLRRHGFVAVSRPG
jgi:AcrR family transcriptional regulator